jgi:hypothetical protein
MKTPGVRVMKTPGVRAMKTPGVRAMKTPGVRVLKTPGVRVLKAPGVRVLKTPGVRVLKTPGVIAVFLGFALTTSMTQAQDRPDPEALRSGLTEMLSLFSFGSVSVPDQAAQVTQSGADFHVQIPLTGFAAPAGASAEAVAHPAPNGAWDVTSITVPRAGALGASIDQVVSYTLGEQAIHGRLDPKFTTPSTFVAELGVIALHSASFGQDTEQTIGRVALNAKVSSASAGRLDLVTRNSATNWHIVTREPGGAATNGQIRHIDGQAALNGLDHAQAERLMEAAHAMMRTAQAHDRQANFSPAERHDVRAMLDATAGLLTRLEVSQTLEGMKFDLGGGNSGTLDRIRLQVKASADDKVLSAEDKVLNAGIDVALDELSLNTLSAASATLLPHHLTARTVLAGLPTARLTALLQAALAPNADAGALQAQATALLETPGARAAIESVDFDAGPLHVRGSARFLPRPNGEIGADIHISASGTDALVNQAMGKPGLQNVLPMVFLAKGMGRVQGDSIVWDIALGGGPITINGTAFGQPAAPRR